MLRALGDGTLMGAVSGEGAPRVLLLHGWRRTSADFAVVQQRLADDGLSSIALDLPGFGASPPPARAGGARTYAELVGGVLEEFPEPAVLVGHSFGGRVATVLAARQPSRVGRLVVTGAPLLRLGAPARPQRSFRALRALHHLGLLSDERMEAARRRHGSDDYRAASGVVRDVLVATVAETYEEEIDALTVPLSLVWGEDDAVVPLSVAEAVAARRRARGGSVTLDVVPGAGHLTPLTCPERLVAATHESRT